jgi:hypothetical protein
LTIGCCSIPFILSMCEAVEPLIMQKPIYLTPPFVFRGGPWGGGNWAAPEPTDAREQSQGASGSRHAPDTVRNNSTPARPSPCFRDGSSAQCSMMSKKARDPRGSCAF